jgi:hypothetical protein
MDRLGKSTFHKCQRCTHAGSEVKTSGSSACFGENGCVIEISSRPSQEYHRNDSPRHPMLSSSILQLFEDRNQTRILRLIAPPDRKPKTNASEYRSFDFNVKRGEHSRLVVWPYRRLDARTVNPGSRSRIAVPDLPKQAAADIRCASVG